MNSYATTVLPLYASIIEDANARWPDIRSSTGRDMSRLRRAIEDRGLEFLTLTLPSLGPWFDKSLDSGRLLDADLIPRGIKRYRGRPLLFAGVLDKVFDYDGMLRQDVDHWAVLCYRTLLKVCAKLELPPSESMLHNTVKEFCNVDDALPPPYHDSWESDLPSWQKRRGHPLWGGNEVHTRSWPDLYDRATAPQQPPPWDTLRHLCRRALTELGPVDWWELQPKHGPGAVYERRLESKYEFRHWSERLDRQFPYDWFGSGSLAPESVPKSKGLVPSRLVAVPKDRKAPRLICAEPAANQWMQQSIWRWLDGRIKRTVLGRSISFRSQENSRERALRGSASSDEATLDLSEASDRLSCRLVEYIFQDRHDLLDAFHAVRTPYVEQTISNQSPRLIRLRKFSTMGSALTFPVQSIVFTLLSVWALRLYEGREDDWSDWKSDFDRVRVFGDDIIVPTHSYRLTTFVLHECGLRVNLRKSYSGDNFRESCGCDAFNGVDVTPPRHRRVYDGSASSTAALIEFSNHLHLKGFWRAADFVLGLLPKSVTRLLWVHGPDEAPLGLASFVKGWKPPTLRWDPDLQRHYAVRIAFSAKVKRTDPQGYPRLLQYFTEDPASQRDRRDVIHWEPGQPRVERLRLHRSRVYC